MDALRELASQWRAEADTLEQYADERGASILRLHANQLERAATAAEQAEVSMQEAAELSGYSPRRLRELAAAGELPNVGKKGRPRFRVADLPRKPGGTSSDGIDVQGIARRLAS